MEECDDDNFFGNEGSDQPSAEDNGEVNDGVVKVNKPTREYGATEITKMLFRDFFRVIGEKQDGTLLVECLSCFTQFTIPEKNTSNLTRHLVRVM